MLECGTPKAADRYQRAGRAAACAVEEANTKVWEGFREVMEEDNRWLEEECVSTEGWTSLFRTLQTQPDLDKA